MAALHKTMPRYLAFRFHYNYQYPEMPPGLEIVRDEELEHEEQQVHRQGDQHRLPGRQFSLSQTGKKPKPSWQSEKILQYVKWAMWAEFFKYC